MYNYNKLIIDKLREYLNNEKVIFKKNAYLKVIKNLNGKDIYTIKDIENVKGIGKGIKEKIEKVLEIKIPEKKDNYNKPIIDKLTEYLNNEKVIFKRNAYLKVIKNLNGKDIYTIKDIENVKGIGKGIKEKIEKVLEIKIPEKKDNYNKPIIDKLTEYLNNEKVIFKRNAYLKAIKNLRGKEVYTIKDVENVEGIGKGIKEKIEKVLEMKIPEKMSEDLTKIYGIGPVKQKQLNDKGILRIEELKENLDLLNDKQKIGIKYYEDLDKRIPYEEMSVHDNIIKNILKGINGINDYSIVGSYRRMKRDSGDIDILVNSDTKVLKEIVESGIKKGYILEILACKDIKFMGIVKLSEKDVARRIDIMVTNKKEYPLAQLYFTGSKEHNIMMRNKAKEKGYKLNEHKLINMENNEIVDIKNEDDIFRFLDIKYVDPKNR